MKRDLLIGFTGQMHSGKTECVRYVTAKLEAAGYYVVSVKFAEPIYTVTQTMCEQLGLTFDKQKIRPVMQFIGTHMRQAYGEDFWVDQWDKAREHAEFFSALHAPTKPVAILNDDTRFDNEARKIRSLGGHIMMVHSLPEIRAARAALVNPDHASEKGIDHDLVTRNIFNNGTVEDLHKHLDFILGDLLETEAKVQS